jgi:hypothetical protein
MKKQFRFKSSFFVQFITFWRKRRVGPPPSSASGGGGRWAAPGKKIKINF